MDFKVAGTKDGITAIQLDVKIDGLTDEIIKKLLKRAKDRKSFIFWIKCFQVITSVTTSLSQYAPRVNDESTQDKIGEVIGPGGKSSEHHCRNRL